MTDCYTPDTHSISTPIPPPLYGTAHHDRNENAMSIDRVVSHCTRNLRGSVFQPLGRSEHSVFGVNLDRVEISFGLLHSSTLQLYLFFFFLMIRRPPKSTLFPSTTLFR